MFKCCATSNCIVCGKPAVHHHGYVIAKEKMALGNLIDVKVTAGFCDDCNNTIQSDVNGCYGKYDSEKHGFIENIFKFYRDRRKK
ncbi:hypothetical protein [Clostridium botulinum]|uniref:hypothetical protein n=1 Tax=Clostridium botulinum TaxID=1491 RepID=UPI0007731344|nr:hypothetical protein [Clostridium botulinum]EGT5649373.1 hypothetical protein [Clostridium botulinum]KEI96392.1 hypothetical protein N497_17785 [Clostridium botulinum F 357]MBY6755493.1 hypothetical protein [Clostridium botulinum]MBY6766420.1 hypothetical protein [Clostridium botulinum]MBY6900376.1 hypothetical protein [Clostridium botulinum]